MCLQFVFKSAVQSTCKQLTSQNKCCILVLTKFITFDDRSLGISLPFEKGVRTSCIFTATLTGEPFKKEKKQIYKMHLTFKRQNIAMSPSQFRLYVVHSNSAYLRNRFEIIYKAQTFVSLQEKATTLCPHWQFFPCGTEWLV